MKKKIMITAGLVMSAIFFSGFLNYDTPHPGTNPGMMQEVGFLLTDN